ncbi:MAG: hypothetical protein MK100_02600 [Phycisphaerales bacterium]|nr:hypothetical protein [Phycisphaerales bacterium]
MAMALSIGAAWQTSSAAPTIEILEPGIGGVLPLGQPGAIKIRVDPDGLDGGTYHLEWVSETPEGDQLVRGLPLPLGGTPVDATLFGDVPPNKEATVTIRLRNPDGGDLVAATTIRPMDATLLTPGEEFIVVIGDQRFGLQQYDESRSERVPWTDQFATVRAVTINELPRHDPPLDVISSIVVTGSSLPRDPDRLTQLRAWMERGGHLIISLPSTSNDWALGQPNGPWSDLLPKSSEVSSIPMWALANVISPDPIQPKERDSLAVRTFAEDIRSDPYWHVIHNSATGDPLTIAKGVGLGRLTVSGLDITSPLTSGFSLTEDATGALPSAATFWKPVLARRDIAPTPRQIRLALEQSPRNPTPAREVNLNGSSASQNTRSTVETTGRVIAVLAWLAFCWLICGPLIWTVVNRRQRQDLAWPLFGAISLMGAFVAWALGSTLGLNHVQTRHFSVVDIVPHEQIAKTQSWIELGLPGDGEQLVSSSAEDLYSGWIAPWQHPDDATFGFSNTQPLFADLNKPLAMPVQARGTALGLMLNAMSARPVGNLEVIDPLRTKSSGSATSLTGSIRNELNATLSDVSIVWVEARYMPHASIPTGKVDASEGGQMPVRIWNWRLDEWLPGHVLDLSGLDHAEGHRNARLEDRLAMNADGLSKSVDDDGNAEAEALSLFSLHAPPEWVATEAGTAIDSVVMRRSFGQSLDLGAQLGSPTLLITGFLDDSPLPIPLTVDDRPVTDSRGKTMVRWRIPLPDRPPIVAQPPPSR